MTVEEAMAETSAGYGPLSHSRRHDALNVLAAEVQRLRVLGYQHVDRLEKLEEELRALRPKYVEAFDELALFRKREALVHQLLEACGAYNVNQPGKVYAGLAFESAELVRDFDLNPKAKP